MERKMERERITLLVPVESGKQSNAKRAITIVVRFFSSVSRVLTRVSNLSY